MFRKIYCECTRQVGTQLFGILEDEPYIRNQFGKVFKVITVPLNVIRGPGIKKMLHLLLIIPGRKNDEPDLPVDPLDHFHEIQKRPA